MRISDLLSKLEPGIRRMIRQEMQGISPGSASGYTVLGATDVAVESLAAGDALVWAAIQRKFVNFPMARPILMVERTTAEAITSTTPEPLEWETSDPDPGFENGWDIANPARLLPPWPGDYFINCFVDLSITQSTSVDLQLQYSAQGAALVKFAYTSGYGDRSAIGVNIAGVVGLEPGDWLEVWIDTGRDITLLSAVAQLAYWGIPPR